MVYNLGLIRKFLNNESAVIVFKAYILSRVEYGAIFCISARNSVLNKLQKIVNRGLRICYRTNYYESNYNLHVKARLLPLRLRRKLATLNQVYLMNQRLLKGSPLKDGIDFISRKVTRHNKLNYIRCEFPRFEWYRRSVVYQGPKYWEILPSRLKIICDKTEFKGAITDYYTLMFREEGFV